MLLTALCVLVTLIPFPYLILQFFENPFYFPEYLHMPLIKAFGNGILLTIITGLFALLWAVPAAVVLGLYHIPYRQLWVGLLVIPLAIPSYLSAFVYSDLLYYTSSLGQLYQSFTGELLPFNIRSTVGGGFVLSLSLYPYIFLPLYTRIRSFDQNIIDYAYTVGHKKISIVRKLILRSSIPTVLFGLTLIMLEALSDYGTVSYLGINSPSLFLFDIWQQTGDIAISVNITLIYLVLTGCIFIFSHYVQKAKSYSSSLESGNSHKFMLKNKVSVCWVYIWLAFIFCIAFLIPTAFYSYHLLASEINFQILPQLLGNSLVPIIVSASLCVVMGLIFGYYSHYGTSKTLKYLIMLATSGYAIPGVILGIAVFIGLIFSNRTLNIALDIKWVFASGSILGLIICYYIKFLTVAYGAVSPVFKSVNLSIFYSALTFGYGQLHAFWRVYMPFFTKPMAIAFIMVTVDILKELPMTLLMRPLGFETFATFTYNMAALEQIPQASGAALVLIVMGTLAAFIPLMTKG